LATATPDLSDEEDQLYDSEEEEEPEEQVDVELEEDAAAFLAQDGSRQGYIDAEGLRLVLIQVKRCKAQINRKGSNVTYARGGSRPSGPELLHLAGGGPACRANRAFSQF